MLGLSSRLLTTSFSDTLSSCDKRAKAGKLRQARAHDLPRHDAGWRRSRSRPVQSFRHRKTFEWWPKAAISRAFVKGNLPFIFPMPGPSTEWHAPPMSCSLGSTRVMAKSAYYGCTTVKATVHVGKLGNAQPCVAARLYKCTAFYNHKALGEASVSCRVAFIGLHTKATTVTKAREATAATGRAL
ncbi:hypothetical protein EJ06DRAFT_298241 [Trichodelitschia bisporula]|uniref:Uncharacterized protein n=1 Tax=Trichodelitschia bisporula TaxID=703511 RepID=A0A6G1I6H0_9PEZI|nr:hypothetical protein EJ06DRAFT_298241 [Trichodelitschia bisporula]